jgi:hypothetical protein
MRLLVPALALLFAGCSQRGAVEVDHPFYLMTIEDPAQFALFRCPEGPDRGCAIDGLPGPLVTAAGADPRFIVVEQQPLAAADGPRLYYYFARVPQETSGWGLNPERIVGPLDEAAFAAASAQLNLPPLTVHR